jgi:hypothetical protein
VVFVRIPSVKLVRTTVALGIGDLEPTVEYTTPVNIVFELFTVEFHNVKLTLVASCAVIGKLFIVPELMKSINVPSEG